MSCIHHGQIPCTHHAHIPCTHHTHHAHIPYPHPMHTSCTHPMHILFQLHQGCPSSGPTGTRRMVVSPCFLRNTSQTWPRTHSFTCEITGRPSRPITLRPSGSLNELAVRLAAARNIASMRCVQWLCTCAGNAGPLSHSSGHALSGEVSGARKIITSRRPVSDDVSDHGMRPVFQPVATGGGGGGGCGMRRFSSFDLDA